MRRGGCMCRGAAKSESNMCSSYHMQMLKHLGPLQILVTCSSKSHQIAKHLLENIQDRLSLALMPLYQREVRIYQREATTIQVQSQLDPQHKPVGLGPKLYICYFISLTPSIWNSLCHMLHSTKFAMEPISYQWKEGELRKYGTSKVCSHLLFRL